VKGEKNILEGGLSPVKRQQVKALPEEGKKEKESSFTSDSLQLMVGVGGGRVWLVCPYGAKSKGDALDREQYHSACEKNGLVPGVEGKGKGEVKSNHVKTQWGNKGRRTSNCGNREYVDKGRQS